MTMTTLRKNKAPPTVAYETAVVSIVGYFYDVDFGSGTSRQAHRVGKDKRCTCPLGAGCPAVAAVAEYLKAGGERAPDPPPGFYPVAPASCPICRAGTVYDPHLSSKRRGAGWRCVQGGSRHYWEAHVQVLKQKLTANPWLFPPVVIREGVQILAYDDRREGDALLYPGVLRAEIISYSDGQ